VAVAWQVYSLTRRPLGPLGLVGTGAFRAGPSRCSWLPDIPRTASHAERSVQVCCLVFSLCSLSLTGLTLVGLRSVWPMYAVLLMTGVVQGPLTAWASQRWSAGWSPGPPFRTPYLDDRYPNADAGGPVAGRSDLCAGGQPVPVYVASLRRVWRPSAVGVDGSGAKSNGLHRRPPSPWCSKASVTSAQTAHPGTISLDLFAVLLEGRGSVAGVRRDVLNIGASGGAAAVRTGSGRGDHGADRGSPPLRRRAGAKMLACVFGFGVCIVVFGLSRNLWLSLAALVLTGALEMVSVIVRQTMVQVATPDHMRGRVSAVNSVFIGASNEVGQFESGLTAHWFGTVPAVVLGGVGTMAVVLLWTRLFPSLRRIDDLTAPPPAD